MIRVMQGCPCCSGNSEDIRSGDDVCEQEVSVQHVGVYILEHRYAVLEMAGLEANAMIGAMRVVKGVLHLQMKMIRNLSRTLRYY
jgi:hypothetical protein